MKSPQKSHTPAWRHGRHLRALCEQSAMTKEEGRQRLLEVQAKEARQWPKPDEQFWLKILHANEMQGFMSEPPPVAAKEVAP